MKKSYDVTAIKRELVSHIIEIIKASGQTQRATARRIDLDQPKLSHLLKGDIRGYSIDRLLSILNHLGYDVVVKIRPAATEKGSIKIIREKKMKIAINATYGAFHLSPLALKFLEARGLIANEWAENIPRNHPILIEAIETLQDKASDILAHVKVIEIPEGVEFIICEYDGKEWVAEKHRTWRYEEK